jgi:transcriptional regulator with XRE-family HTH domain
MKTTNHKLQVFRENHHLTLEDVEVLLGNEKSFTSLHRYETKHVVPQLKLSILYHLLFDIPIDHFFIDTKRELRQRLLVRIPNIIDDISILKSQNIATKKIKVLSKALENLANQENHDQQQIKQRNLFN